jgi:hypothetical protein
MKLGVQLNGFDWKGGPEGFATKSVGQNERIPPVGRPSVVRG